MFCWFWLGRIVNLALSNFQVLGRTVQRNHLLPGHRQQHDVGLRHRQARPSSTLGHEAEGAGADVLHQAPSRGSVQPGVQRRLRHVSPLRRPGPVPQPDVLRWQRLQEAAAAAVQIKSWRLAQIVLFHVKA